MLPNLMLFVQLMISSLFKGSSDTRPYLKSMIQILTNATPAHLFVKWAGNKCSVQCTVTSSSAFNAIMTF